MNPIHLRSSEPNCFEFEWEHYLEPYTPSERVIPYEIEIVEPHENLQRHTIGSSNSKKLEDIPIDSFLFNNSYTFPQL